MEKGALSCKDMAYRGPYQREFKEHLSGEQLYRVLFVVDRGHPLRYVALNGTDHRSHAGQNAAIAACIRWRDARARPKTGFATDSPIRSWTDYPAKVA
jgi:hypothetical protein